MARMNRDFYIPQESQYRTNVQKLVPEGTDLEIYTYLNSAGKPCAMYFGGKRSKPDASYQYSSEERRAEAIQNTIDSAKKTQACKAARAAEQKAVGRGLEVGDHLICSWGYDQTNVNFYKVVALKGQKSVLILPVGSKRISVDGSSDRVVPDEVVRDYDTLLGFGRDEVEPVAKLAKNGSVRLSDHYAAIKWDGKPCYETAAGFGH